MNGSFCVAFGKAADDLIAGAVRDEAPRGQAILGARAALQQIRHLVVRAGHRRREVARIAHGGEEGLAVVFPLLAGVEARLDRGAHAVG